jgi:catechol 2,3-dioxygenase-like lactoylglutathione lyase family enzyme
MPVARFDHVAIPARDPEVLLTFYRALGFPILYEEEWRAGNGVPAIGVGPDQKINVHPPALWQRPDFTLRGPTAEPGSADLCFVWSGTVAEVEALLAGAGATIERGPIPMRGGARAGEGRGTSIYTRDPEQNLVEFIVYEG